MCNEKQKQYYCRHCGHDSYNKNWQSFSNYRCPQCTAETAPKER